MTFTTQQVESITQRVIQQLRGRGIAIGVSPASQPARREAQGKTAAVKTSGPASEADVIDIRSKIITEDVLIDAQVAGRLVRFPEGALVTPSGRDYLRLKGVRIADGGSVVAEQLRGVAILSETSVTLLSALKTAGWSAVTATSDFQAATKAAQDCNTAMLLSARQPSVAACLLNRNKAFRAAVVSTSTDWTKLQTVMNPNLICLNPKGWSIAGLVSLLKQLSENPQQPAMWQEI